MPPIQHNTIFEVLISFPRNHDFKCFLYELIIRQLFHWFILFYFIRKILVLEEAYIAEKFKCNRLIIFPSLYDLKKNENDPHLENNLHL